MKLCMFHPNDNPMERGWVGRIDGARVLHLAAQTLQSFFLGGGGAREHAEYALADVTLLVPVLYPPAVRVFESEDSFAFANPSAVYGPGAAAVPPGDAASLTLAPRVAAVIGAEGAVGGYSLYAEWREPGRPAPKDRDFCVALGPVVATPDELDLSVLEVLLRVDGDERLTGSLGGFDWEAAVRIATDQTLLRPGDLVVSPAVGELAGLDRWTTVELEAPGIGVLSTKVAG